MQSEGDLVLLAQAGNAVAVLGEHRDAYVGGAFDIGHEAESLGELFENDAFVRTNPKRGGHYDGGGEDFAFDDVGLHAGCRSAKARTVDPRETRALDRLAARLIEEKELDVGGCFDIGSGERNSCARAV